MAKETGSCLTSPLYWLQQLSTLKASFSLGKEPLKNRPTFYGTSYVSELSTVSFPVEMDICLKSEPVSQLLEIFKTSNVSNVRLPTRSIEHTLSPSRSLSFLRRFMIDPRKICVSEPTIHFDG
jgi:hypothetical protein